LAGSVVPCLMARFILMSRASQVTASPTAGEQSDFFLSDQTGCSMLGDCERTFMTDIQRQAQATWTGDLRHGEGKFSTQSGVLRDLSFSVPSRFEDGKGTNPEELLAAAHASCFSMMLSKVLGDQNKTPKQISTKATLTVSRADGGFKISKIHLQVDGAVDGLDQGGFRRAAELAKDQCPVSVLLAPGLEAITLEARLVS
jgi:lipoyl-dependent peroxiredoxin